MSSRIARPIASPNGVADLAVLVVNAASNPPIIRETLHPFIFFHAQRSQLLGMAKVGGWHRWAGDQSGGWSIPSDASVESGLAASKLIGLTHSLLLNFDGEFVPALPLFQHAEVKQPLLREISVGFAENLQYRRQRLGTLPKREDSSFGHICHQDQYA